MNPNYQERLKLLRMKKIEQTQDKIKANGYMDADDYGTIALPADFSFTPISNHANGGFYGARAYADNFAALMNVHPVYVDPLEILCGRWMAMMPSWRKPWPEDRFPTGHLKAGQALYGIGSGIGADAHFASDYMIGLELGWKGLLDKVRHYRNESGSDKKEFYDAEEQVILSIQSWIGRHLTQIQLLIDQEADPVLRQSLMTMLECNKRVIEDPPESFLEACQWIVWFSLVSRIYDRDGAGCQLDQILYPYYIKDKQAGLINDEDAIFILANLLLIETHYHQLSGADAQGNDLTNHLSWLILEAAHRINASANLTIRVHDQMDPAYFRKGIEYLFTDRNGWPRFSGDRGLMGYARLPGVDVATARSRIAVGCNWMAVPGREYPMNDCIKINVAKVFEVAWLETMSSPSQTLEALFASFEKHLKQAVDLTAEGILIHLKHQHEVMPELVMNLMMRHTIEEGLDITQCAELFTIGIDGVGLGTVADSFAAIEHRIVREKRVSFSALHHALITDFAGNERLRQMLLHSERYCQGNSLGDLWAERVSALFTRLVRDKAMPDRVTLIPGWFSWSSTIMFGHQVMATPDGRHAHAPVTHGANPNPGFRKDGAPTAMATGIARIQPGYGNPAPLQLEFDPHLSAEAGGIDRVAAVVKTHLDMNGTLVNINVLDKDKLMAAHADPSLYPDLVVRVTGFTAYFAALSPQFRQLVIDRFVEGI